METLAEVIKTGRETKGLLLGEVASLIDVDTAMISRFEKGDRNPTRSQLQKLATALNLNFENILTENKELKNEIQNLKSELNSRFEKSDTNFKILLAAIVVTLLVTIVMKFI